MRRKLAYEDFRRNPPSKEIQERHRAEIHKSAKETFQKKIELAKAQREQYEPYRRALAEFYKKQGVEQPGLRRSDVKDFRQTLAHLKAPSPPRLRRRIFQTGSFHIVDIPTLSEPFVAWADLENASPSNDASSSVVSVDGASGRIEGLEASASFENSGPGANAPGGAAAGWGYIGQYFTPPTDLGIDWAEAFLQISAAPTIAYTQDWGVNFFNYANQVLTANIRLIIYDSNWNQTGTLDFQSANWNPIATNNPFNQGPLIPTGFSITPQLNGSAAVSTDNHYGIFVQFYAWSEASGGSWAWGSMNCTLPAIQLDALCMNLP